MPLLRGVLQLSPSAQRFQLLGVQSQTFGQHLFGLVLLLLLHECESFVAEGERAGGVLLDGLVLVCDGLVPVLGLDEVVALETLLLGERLLVDLVILFVEIGVLDPAVEVFETFFFVHGCGEFGGLQAFDFLLQLVFEVGIMSAVFL